MAMDWYLFTKALHIIAVVCWFAGLFYLPRLMVYYAEATDDAVKATLITMQHKLLKLITTPAMLVTWLLGFALTAQNPHVATECWFLVKLPLVLALSGFHGSLAVFHKQQAAGQCAKTSKFFRLYNEIPTILLVGIVVLAVVRPF